MGFLQLYFLVDDMGHRYHRLLKGFKMEIRVLQGKQIIPFIQKIAEFRIEIFHEYPYLYDGSLCYEERYLHMYSQTEDAVLIVATEDEQIIGVVTGLPLKASLNENIELFSKYHMSLDGIFYLGEIVLLKKYRNKNIGFSMYQKFEETVRKLGKYKNIALSEVKRPDNDPKRPTDYKSLTEFWHRLGYVKYPKLVAYYSWREKGDTVETKHPMVFSMKELK